MQIPARQQILTWHPPGYTGTDPKGWFGRPFYAFKFTGTEPRPTNPPWLNDAYDVAYARPSSEGPPGDSSNWDRELTAALHRIVDECEQAVEAWEAARYELAVVEALRKVVPALKEFRRARSTAAAAYAALDDTPDGKWRSALLHLTRARTAALDAAEKLDRATYPIAEAWEAMPCRGDRAFERTRRVEKIAADHGMDAGGTSIDDFDLDCLGGYGSSPTQQKLKREYDQQDKDIAEVTRLAGAMPQRD